jgi:hypothetical protein
VDSSALNAKLSAALVLYKSFFQSSGYRIAVDKKNNKQEPEQN